MRTVTLPILAGSSWRWSTFVAPSLLDVEIAGRVGELGCDAARDLRARRRIARQPSVASRRRGLELGRHDRAGAPALLIRGRRLSLTVRETSLASRALFAATRVKLRAEPGRG